MSKDDFFDMIDQSIYQAVNDDKILLTEELHKELFSQ